MISRDTHNSACRRRLRNAGAFVVAAVLGAHVSHAQIIVPGADGSDGPFSTNANIQIDLSEASPATWNTPSPTPGKGVYDSDKWAVVFKYASVNIPSNVTVTYKNNKTHAPVVWLVTGSANINGPEAVSGT